MDLKNKYSKSGHSGSSIGVNGKFVLVNNGYINGRVDYVVIREFDLDDVQSRLSDNRYIIYDFLAYINARGDIDSYKRHQ